MEWLIYLCKVSACMGLFYTSFHLLLRKLTFFGTNRIYLLTTFFISFAIPLLVIRVETDATAEPTPQAPVVHQTSQLFLPAPETPDPVRSPEAIDIDWTVVVSALYWIIALGLLGSFLIQLLKLATHARKVSEKHGHLKVIHKKTGFTNCSFLNYVFLDPEKLSESELAILLRHEQVHVSQLHTVDKLLFNLGKSILWFNPFIYLYGQALEQTHEYEADRKASDAVGASPYAGILLNIASRQNGLSLPHSFAVHPVKARIQMLFTNKSKVMKKLFYLSTLPLAGVLVWAFAVQIVSASPQTETISFVEPEALQTDVTPQKEDLTALEITEAKKEEVKAPSDTLWMVRPANYGPHTRVTIDGSDYEVDILSNISPRCIKSFKGSEKHVEITTYDNEIIYATEIEKKNLRTERAALDNDRFLVRYTQRSEGGDRYDYAVARGPGGSVAGVSLPRRGKLLVLIDGKLYTEAQLRKVKISDVTDINGMRASDFVRAELQEKYGKKFDSVIEIFKNDTSARNPVDKADSIRAIKPSVADTSIISRRTQYRETLPKNPSNGPDTSLVGMRTQYRGNLPEDPTTTKPQ